MCSSVRRIYIPEKYYEELANLITSKIQAYKLGNPMDVTTTVGPLKTRAQVDILNNHIADALDNGAEIAYGLPNQQSQLYVPTLLKYVTPNCLTLQEEHFGPLIPLVKSKDINNAIELANQSEYGLNASIWHDNLEEAELMAQNLEVGTVTINTLPGTNNYCSWHGVKLSGIGCVLSSNGIRQFVDRKNIRFDYKNERL